MSRQPRTIVIITEGATPELLDRWCAAGQLPNFARLRAEGATGPLEADGVPYEPPGLLSLLTGRRPGDHGFFSYWTVHDPEYRPQVLTSAGRRHPLLWQDDSLAGVRFAAVGLFGTHPPEPLDGWLITYPMFPSLRACHPARLQRDLNTRGIRTVHDTSIWWHGQAKDELLPQLLEADEQRGRAVMDLFDGGADVALVNLTSIDRTSHIYWQELELGPEREAGSAILAAYKTCDRILGEALRRVDEHTSVIAFSEIGFGPLRAYCSINDDLAAAGLLARDADGAVDWAGTQAFEAVQGTHGININMRGRYKNGHVAENDYERVRQSVADALLASLNPRTGLPFFTAVRPREEVHSGEAVNAAPDLILEPADWRYLPLGDPTWATQVHRTWQSGWHRPRSYWGIYGPGVTAGATHRVAAPVDIAATLYHLLGRDVPESFAGTPLPAR